MREIYLDGLKIHNLTEFQNRSLGYLVTTPIVGLDAPKIALSSYNRAGEDGIRITSGFVRERRITLNGYIFGQTLAAHYALRRALEAKTLPTRVSGQLSSKILRIITDEGNDYSIPVQVADYTSQIENGQMARFQIDLLANDVAIYATTVQSVTLSPSESGGFLIPFLIPFLIGGSAAGQATANNGGNVITYPTITMTGPLTNPSIKNSTLNQTIQLTLTMNVGDTLVIDMQNRTVVLNGTTNQLVAMSSLSRFWGLEPGDNSIIFSTTTPGEAGECTVSWQDASMGL